MEAQYTILADTRDGFLTERQESHPIRRRPFSGIKNPAAIVVEVIPLADSKLNGGILRHDARFLVPERARRLL